MYIQFEVDSISFSRTGPAKQRVTYVRSVPWNSSFIGHFV